LDLRGILKLAEELPLFNKLLNNLKSGLLNAPAEVIEAAKPFVIAAIRSKLGQPIMVITSQPEKARQLYEQLLNWCPPDEVALLPEPELLPYQRAATDALTEQERLNALSVICGKKPVKESPLVVTAVSSLISRVTGYEAFTSVWQRVVQGENTDLYKLLRNWQAIGYRLEDVVEVPGTISHRGGIVDIYPVTAGKPYRLEFFGNTLESIRSFDPESQRSLEEVSSITVGPAIETLKPLLSTGRELERILSTLDLLSLNEQARNRFEEDIASILQGGREGFLNFYAPLFNDDCILSYLPRNALVIVDEPEAIKKQAGFLIDEAEGLRQDKLKRKELPSGFPNPYFTWEEITGRLEKKRRLSFISLGTGDGKKARLNFTNAPTYTTRLPVLFKKMKELLKEKLRFIITSHQASRLGELLAEEGIPAEPVKEVLELPPPGSLVLVQGSLTAGWIMEAKNHLLTDSELFGFVRKRSFVKKHPVSSRMIMPRLKPGELVVHIEHGVARFAGITTMSADDILKEYLVLEYAAGDKLYVPVDQVDRVGRYVGAGDRQPVLNRLGTQEWAKARRNAAESARQVAGELLDLYATREVVPGYAFSGDTVWQQELEASFPYIETPDQISAQRQVKEDMEKAMPMDRLVLGDVGYGKTEVAIRAAFKAVMDGRQVAVLVPTTILAQQHLATFSQRLAAFPVKLEVLSRFRKPSEQKAILKSLASGSLDIIIGTHRLLQKDVSFKDLGLLIIDEEQRFGVNHKEYLKKMRREVDVLTLSATPIPRTLHMSMVGVRDLSIIETPPGERLPIRTYVASYDKRLVREAILRELERNGQVFFVHNRVQSIDYILRELQKLVPEARMAVAHGQMAKGELERVMAAFASGEIDVLVCSTIIESGVDVPNANTLIINQADRFGLTQLYQLRGRVGRGTNLAYAYLLYEGGKWMTADAEKRLKTIFEATELGAGFGIAMKDLEIRGAGNLLGLKQSGHINAVGFNLYNQLLAEAVEERKALKSGVPIEEIKSRRLPPPVVDLPQAALIPGGYISSESGRLEIYKKLAGVKDLAALKSIGLELKDRYGKLPDEVMNLLYAVKVKLMAARAGVESVAIEHGQIVVRLIEGMTIDNGKLESIVGDGVTIGKRQLKLDYRAMGRKWRKILEEVLKFLS